MAARQETTAVAVGTTATALFAVNGHRRSAWIHNNGSATIFVGGASVTTGTGLPIPAGEKLPLYSGYEDTISASSALYGVAAALQVAPADTRILASYST